MPDLFHDVDSVTGFACPVFRKLVIVTFSLAEQVGTDTVQIRIADADLSGRDHIFHGTVANLHGTDEYW